jgi:phosphoribosylglycinamide formyltransferase 1
MEEPIALAVLLSAGGTTLQNLLDRIADGRLRARIALVISSNTEAFGLVRAERAGVPAEIVERRDFATIDDFSGRIFDLCRRARVSLVCMAGFLRLVHIPDDFLGKVMNIHPSLIPAFCGKGYFGHHVHEAVLDYGAKVSGCTVHFTDNQYDHGPIILQKAVPVLEDDDPDRLAQRIYQQECEAYPEAIRLFAEGRLRVDGRRIQIAPPQ